MNSLLTRSVCVSALVIGLVSAVSAADGPTNTDPSSAATEYGYLGVYVTPSHPALSANLKHLLKQGQGLTVDEIAEKSAASRAGIKIHDVLTSYDDQKLFSVEQFAKLVHSDKPGRKVMLEVLRKGKLEKIQVELGKLDSADFRAWSPTAHSQPYRFGSPDRVPARIQSHQLSAAEWKNLDSLTVKKVSADKLRVELQHVEQNGDLHKHAFEGTREEIHKQILESADVKPAERGHLLRVLNLYDPGNAAPFPHIWFEPGEGWLFEQPGGPFH